MHPRIPFQETASNLFGKPSCHACGCFQLQVRVSDRTLNYMYKYDIVLFALQTHAPLFEDVVADHPLATVAEAKGFRAHEVEHAPLLHQAITKQALSVHQ